MRREMGAAASSARGWAGTGRRGAHMGASVVVELRRVHELMSGQERGKKKAAARRQVICRRRERAGKQCTFERGRKEYRSVGG